MKSAIKIAQNIAYRDEDGKIAITAEVTKAKAIRVGEIILSPGEALEFGSWLVAAASIGLDQQLNMLVKHVTKGRK